MTNNTEFNEALNNETVNINIPAATTLQTDELEYLQRLKDLSIKLRSAKIKHTTMCEVESDSYKIKCCIKTSRNSCCSDEITQLETCYKALGEYIECLKLKREIDSIKNKLDIV